MDKSDAFKCEVDNAKEVILLMDREARIDDWSDRELMSRLALVSSLEEGKDEV
jgi:predicted RNA-binding Zn ribbon-like protein